MSFQLDTSGMIDMEPGEVLDRGHLISWPSLSPFTQGYVEALFDRAYHDGVFAVVGFRLPAFSDLAPETLARIIADCEFYQTHNPGLWSRISGGRARKLGQEAWTLRQNGNLPQQPPLTVQLGDDGKVRFA